MVMWFLGIDAPFDIVCILLCVSSAPSSFPKLSYNFHLFSLFLYISLIAFTQKCLWQLWFFYVLTDVPLRNYSLTHSKPF